MDKEYAYQIITEKNKTYAKLCLRLTFIATTILSFIGLFPTEHNVFDPYSNPTISVFMAFLGSLLLATVVSFGIYAFTLAIDSGMNLIFKWMLEKQTIQEVTVESHNHWNKFYDYYQLISINGEKIKKPYVIRSPFNLPHKATSGYLVKGPVIHYFFPK